MTDEEYRRTMQVIRLSNRISVLIPEDGMVYAVVGEKTFGLWESRETMMASTSLERRRLGERCFAWSRERS